MINTPLDALVNDAIRKAHATEQREDLETSLHAAARAAAEKIAHLSEPLYPSEPPMRVNEIASIIYEAVRNAREL